jgi:hypothetical protein
MAFWHIAHSPTSSSSAMELLQTVHNGSLDPMMALLDPPSRVRETRLRESRYVARARSSTNGFNGFDNIIADSANADSANADAGFDSANAGASKHPQPSRRPLEPCGWMMMPYRRHN